MDPNRRSIRQTEGGGGYGVPAYGGEAGQQQQQMIPQQQPQRTIQHIGMGGGGGMQDIDQPYPSRHRTEQRPVQVGGSRVQSSQQQMISPQQQYYPQQQPQQRQVQAAGMGADRVQEHREVPSRQTHTLYQPQQQYQSHQAGVGERGVQPWEMSGQPTTLHPQQQQQYSASQIEMMLDRDRVMIQQPKTGIVQVPEPRVPSTSMQQKEQTKKITYTPRAPGSYTESEVSDGDSLVDDNDINGQRANAQRTIPLQPQQYQQQPVQMSSRVPMEGMQEYRTGQLQQTNVPRMVPQQQPQQHSGFRQVEMMGGDNSLQTSKSSQQPQMVPNRRFTSSHGEKYLQILEERHQTGKMHEQIEPVARHDPRTVTETRVQPPARVPQQEQRQTGVRFVPSHASDTSVMAHPTRVSRENELKKIGGLLSALVKYHSPRYMLLDDLITLGEAVEPRFGDIENISGIGYLDFVGNYCTDVTMFKRGDRLYVEWTGSG